MDIDEQMDFFVKVVRQIRDQIEFVLPGNHDSERLAKYTKSRRWLNSLCAEAGVDFDKVYVGKPQRGVSGFVNAGDQKYSFYATHGRTGAIVNKNTQLKRMALSRRHTLLLMGHIHHILWEPQIYTEPQADGTHEIKMQYWLATGGFLKDPSYAEAKSYPMSVIGAPIVRFFSTTNDLDMWQLPYRSHQFKGGIESIVGGVEGIKNWECVKHGYGVVKKCLL